jgi:D-hydroxyproline dehydrogenase subunit alpha
VTDFSDVVIVGAGPAGLSAAAVCRGAGLSVTVLDSGVRAGGQFYRHRAAGLRADADLHHDLDAFEELEAATGDATLLFQHQVWTVGGADGDFTVQAVDRSVAGTGAARTVRGRRLVLATGAHDRPMPFPGWDLPGVLTPGAAQALLKGQGVVLPGRILIAGTGPFLLPVADGLLRRGANVVGVHDVNPVSGWRRQPREVLGQVGKLGEAAGYLSTLVRRRVPLVPQSVVVAAHGTDRLEAVTVAKVDRRGEVREGTEQRIEIEVLACGVGFSPVIELAVQLGCVTGTDPDGSAVVTVDARQRSSVPGVWVAGEMTGVAGAQAALAEGRLAGHAVVQDLTGVRPEGIGALLRQRESLRRFGHALQRVYPEPTRWVDRLTDDTLICRCEEVTAGDVQDAVDLGARDLRSTKLLCRAGMGWCQGRICGPAVARLVGEKIGEDVDVAPAARRPLAAPVPLGVLASLDGPR